MVEDFDAVVERVEERHEIVDMSTDNYPRYITIDANKIGVPLTVGLIEMGWAITACMRKNGGLRVWFRRVRIEEAGRTGTEQVVTF